MDELSDLKPYIQPALLQTVIFKKLKIKFVILIKADKKLFILYCASFLAKAGK